MPDLFPKGWQTDKVAARTSAELVGATVAGAKKWTGDQYRLYRDLVYEAAAGSKTATDFFRALAADLRQCAPNPPPPGWGELYKYAATATNATLSPAEQAWANSLPNQLTGATVQSAQDVRSVLEKLGSGVEKLVDAGANVANAGAGAINKVSGAPGGGWLLAALGAGVLWWLA